MLVELAPAAAHLCVGVTVTGFVQLRMSWSAFCPVLLRPPHRHAVACDCSAVVGKLCAANM